MTTPETPDIATLAARERVVRRAPGIAQRGGTLSGAAPRLRRVCFPTSNGELEMGIAADPPAWVEPTFERLARILAMPRGWDSYGASQVEPACVVAALQTALSVMEDGTPAPAVVPLSCGGVQFEWHTCGIDLEIEFRSPARIIASYEDQRTGETWEETVFDFSRMRRALGELARRVSSCRSH